MLENGQIGILQQSHAVTKCFIGLLRYTSRPINFIRVQVSAVVLRSTGHSETSGTPATAAQKPLAVSGVQGLSQVPPEARCAAYAHDD